MTTATSTVPRTGRLRAAWVGAHAAVPGAPRWARIAAAAVPLAVLPASIWRISWEAHATVIGTAELGRGQVPEWMPMLGYVILLSIFSELLASTAYGMVARWGEVFPRWMPGLRGRRVPRLAAVVPASLGAGILTVLWTWTMFWAVLGRDLQGRPMTPDNPLKPDGWDGWLAIVCYAPLLLWGPLLAALTVAYWRRRTGSLRLTPPRRGGVPRHSGPLAGSSPAAPR